MLQLLACAANERGGPVLQIGQGRAIGLVGDEALGIVARQGRIIRTAPSGRSRAIAGSRSATSSGDAARAQSRNRARAASASSRSGFGAISEG